MKELNEILGIKTKLSTAYHPQTDGQTEQVNQEIEQYLRMFVSHRQNDWPEWIACAEFAYNNKIHTATHISPFFANEIVKIISSNAVKLKLPASFKIHNVINVSRIHPYCPPVAGQSIIPPNLSLLKEPLSMK